MTGLVLLCDITQPSILSPIYTLRTDKRTAKKYYLVLS